MCGRYYFTRVSEDEKLDAVNKYMEKNYPGEYKTGEILPGDIVPAVIDQHGKIVAVPAGFGFPGFQDNKLIINARSETAAEKKTFADSLRNRRMILPASGFYEWSHHDREKTKYLFTVDAMQTIYLCGIYKLIDGAYRFAILTRPANDHGHTVMYLDHGLVGRARQYHKAVCAVNELVDPAEVNRLQGVHSKQILCLFPVVMAPLVKAGGRKDHAPIPQAVGKGFLSRCRFGTRIDNQLVALEARKSEASRNSDDLPLLIYHSRDNIAGKYLSRFVLSGIVLLHVFVDRIQLFILADTGKVVSAAHIVSPNVSHRETQYLYKSEFAIS